VAVTEQDVLHIATLARLGLPAERVGAIVGELNRILEHMAVLQEVDTKSVDPAVSVGALAMHDAEVAEFQRACEQLVERAIEDRGFELDIQAAADLATLVPIALAAAVIVSTGGFGSDLAAVGGGAVGTFLFEKYAHVLGRGIMADARRRWTDVRGRQLAQSLVDAALPTTAPYVRAAIEHDTALARQLKDLQSEI